VVVQAAVGDQEDMSARNLLVDHSADVDAGLADEIPTQFYCYSGAGKVTPNRR
jgi:hypothetical protein